MGSVPAASDPHTSIDIEDPKEPLITCINGKLQSLSPLSSDCCIYRVPKKLRDINEKAYTPQMVSIGPLHHGKEGLEAIEDIKWRYLQDFLVWTEMSSEDLVKFIKEREARIRNCYAETIALNSDDFVKMIVVDATFTIAVLLKCSLGELLYASDRIFDKPWMVLEIITDMLLLENQLPFFILEDLFDEVKTSVASDPNNRPSIIELTYTYFKSFLKMDGIPKNIFESSEIKHFLDFFRICLQPSKQRLSPKGPSRLEFTPSLTELHEAGVRFKVSSSKNLLDMQFTDGVLEIPYIYLSDTAEYFFRNLLAFERCHYTNVYVGDYFLTMDRLVNTPRDAELLIHTGIIGNWLSDNLEVSTLFNNLGKEISANSADNFYYSKLVEDLKAYCKDPWHKWKATLKHDYFKTPWAVISFIAAVILLILTLVQSVCSIISL